MEYIDKTRLMQRIRTGMTLIEAMQEIIEAPAADVAPVVRCGECENWQRGWKPSAAKVGTHFCGITGLCRPADWFCADGKRKDGGQEPPKEEA